MFQSLRFNSDVSLEDSRQSILDQQYRNISTVKSVGSVASAIQALDAATSSMDRLARKAVETFDGLALKRIAKTQSYREFQLDLQIKRGARDPDRMKTVVVAQAAILIEGAATTALMVADGAMAVTEAAAYGFSVSFINVVTGFVTGFFPCRYVGYRIDAIEPKPRDRLIRITAWLGFSASLSLMGLLNFAAARVRVTGSHDDIFNFGQVGVLESFTQYHALAIVVLGGIGGLLAIYKGMTGISDPIPGFLESRHEAEDAIIESGDEAAGRYRGMANDQFKKAMERFDDRIDEIEEAVERRAATLADQKQAIIVHNQGVDAAIEKKLDAAEQERQRLTKIKRKYIRPKKVDTSTLEKLHIPDLLDIQEPQTANDGPDPAEAKQRLEAAYDTTLAVIEEAYASFQADVSAFDLSDEPEDAKGE